MRKIILDTETTGLDLTEVRRIVEIGVVELINRSPTGKTFSQLHMSATRHTGRRGRVARAYSRVPS